MNRHPLDPVSLVAGALFAGLGIAFGAGNVSYSLLELRFVWPLVLTALGGAVLVGARGEHRSNESPDRSASGEAAPDPGRRGS